MAKNVYIGVSDKARKIKSMYVGFPTVPAYTNMVGAIGSFESGSWTYTTTEKTYMALSSTYKHDGSYGSYFYQTSGDATQLTYDLRNSNGQLSLPLNSNHKYYVSIWVMNRNSLSMSISVQWPAGSNNILSGTNTASNTWTQHSAVFSPSSITNGSYGVRICCNNYVSSHVMNIDSLMLIDLTESFGKGNEPTKAWCDSNLAFTTGTVASTASVAHNIVAAWVGDANGVARQIWPAAAATTYTWRKYQTKTATSAVYGERFGVIVECSDWIDIGYVGAFKEVGVNIDTYKTASVSSTGNITLSTRTYGQVYDTQSIDVDTAYENVDCGGEGYFKISNNADECIDLPGAAEQGTGYAYIEEIGYDDNSLDSFSEIYDAEDYATAKVVVALPGQTYAELIGTVTSTNANAYPDMGVHTDGYLYVKVT